MDKRWLLGLAAFFVLFLLYSCQQKNNQIVRPNPYQLDPVVAQLPGFVAELRRAKSFYEGLGWTAKQVLGQGRLTSTVGIKGAELFTDLKAELDVCIDYLRTGLTRRFNEEDCAHIQARLQAAKKKATQFQGWYVQLKEPLVGGASDPLTAAVETFPAWLKQIAEENKEAIKQIRSDLDACRLRNWSEL